VLADGDGVVGSFEWASADDLLRFEGGDAFVAESEQAAQYLVVVLAEEWWEFKADRLAVGEEPGAARVAEGAHAIEVGGAQNAAGEQVFVFEVIDVWAEHGGGAHSVCLQRLLGLEAVALTHPLSDNCAEGDAVAVAGGDRGVIGMLPEACSRPVSGRYHGQIRRWWP